MGVERVKFGHDGQCRLRDRKRKYTNQSLMGTMSKWTFKMTATAEDRACVRTDMP
uniref:Uncharacterized protein n=1 Tax=Arion vulgaris TaxID=1028688 RepID=A0A0B7BQ16_9EUPU